MTPCKKNPHPFPIKTPITIPNHLTYFESLTNNDTPMTDLTITRTFPVSPQQIFNAFTHPPDMRVWWTDDTVFNIDLRVDGRWTITRKEGDTTYLMTGKYLEVNAPHRMKYTIGMPQFSPNSDVITIDTEQLNNEISKMTFIQSGPDITAELEGLPEGQTSESEKGWQQGFDLMEEAWNKQSA